jgi:hypothetical protein
MVQKMSTSLIMTKIINQKIKPKKKNQWKDLNLIKNSMALEMP